MKKKHSFILLGIFLAIALFVKLWSYHLSSTTVLLKGVPLQVLIARTPSQQYRGLGDRDSLGSSDGMIFPMGEASQYGFWMRHMRFPIDIVWFLRGTVVDIAPNVPIEPGVSESALPVYYPRKPADLILELPAGRAGMYGVKIGDTISLP